MTQCPGAECPLQDGCALKDAYLNPGINDTVKLTYAPYNQAEENCDYFFPNGTKINPKDDQQ